MATGTVYGNVNPNDGGTGDATFGEKVYLNYTTSETGSTYTITCKVGIQAYTQAISLKQYGVDSGKTLDYLDVSINDVAYNSSTSTSGTYLYANASAALSIAKGSSKQVFSKVYTYTKSKTATQSKTIYVSSDYKALLATSNIARVWKAGSGYEQSATTSNSSYKTQSFTIPIRTSYSITYDANGGIGAPLTGTKWADEAYTVSNTVPTRVGYTFDKWLISQIGDYVNAGGSISANSNNNFTLVAQWIPNTNTITFDANGGADAPSNITGNTASTVTLPTSIPTCIGYDFVGWATTSTGASTYSAGGNYTVGTASTQTLYAVWRANYVAPVISNLTASRAVYENNTWRDADEGEKLHVKFNYMQATEDGIDLTMAFKVGYKQQSASTYLYTTITGASGLVDAYVDVPIEADYVYDIQAVIEVASQTGGPTHENVTRTTYVAKAYYIIDINSDGTGIAFGKVSEQSGFECAMDTVFNHDVNVVGGITANSYSIGVTSLIDFFYPVGSYYETSNTTFDPNYVWGGTWVKDSPGRVTVSVYPNDTNFGSVGDTGGSKDAIVPEHTHPLTRSKNVTISDHTVTVGNHSHEPSKADYQFLCVAASGASVSRNKVAKGSTTDNYYISSASTIGRYNNTNSTHSSVTVSAHSVSQQPVFTSSDPTDSVAVTNKNLQPYIVVNRWHRIA